MLPLSPTSNQQAVFLKNKAFTKAKEDQNSRNSLLLGRGIKKPPVFAYKNTKLLFPVGCYLGALEKSVKWHSGLVQTSKHLSSLGSKALSCVDSYTPGTSQSFSKY